MYEESQRFPGIDWTRLFYLYPENIDEALLDLLANHPKVVPYVDMPLQHASDAMLKRMRRGHGKNRQMRVVETMREKIPNLTFRTAFIVGHPGETDEEFQELCDFVEWAQFEHVGVFRYSDEESAKSFALDAKVPEKVIGKRHRTLMGVATQDRAQEEQGAGRSRAHGSRRRAERRARVRDARVVTRAKLPEVDGQVYLSGAEVHAGEMHRVRVDQASDYDLVGEVIESRATDARPQREFLNAASRGGWHRSRRKIQRETREKARSACE